MKTKSERAIVLKPHEVRAILAGATQLRRIIKPQPPEGTMDMVQQQEQIGWREWSPTGSWAAAKRNRLPDGSPSSIYTPLCYIRAPFKPGDLLWGKETFAIERDVDNEPCPFIDGRPLKQDIIEGVPSGWFQPHYRATDPTPDLCCESERCRCCREGDPGPHWRSAMHMPRWASRITLNVAGVRVERVQDISPEDALSSGVSVPRCGCEVCSTGSQICPADGSALVEEFGHFWDSINGAGAWERNDFVLVYQVERKEKECQF